MGSSDKKKVQQKTDQAQQQGNAQITNQQNDTFIPMTQNAQNNSINANARGFEDYDRLMGSYNNLKFDPFVPIANTSVNYGRTPELSNSFDQYKNFADTGGFSPTDINSIRERGISPIRSVYQNINNELSRQRALQGGYSPNFGAVSSRLAREGSGQIADQVNNTNAQLAEMIQQGKMFGTQGYGNLSSHDNDLATQVALANQSNTLNTANVNMAGTDRNNQNQLSKLNAQSSLYSANPGLASQFANQFTNNAGLLQNSQGQLNNINQNAVGNQATTAQIPTGFQNALGNIQNIAKIGASVAAPFLPGGAALAGVLPSSQVPNANRLVNQLR